MANISKSGIGPLQQIKSEHLLRIINSLSGEVPNIDVEISGTVTASYFSGDGSGLTNLPSGSYTPSLNGTHYIIAEGQSNMAGISGGTFFNPTTNENVKIWNSSSSEWEVLGITYNTIYREFSYRYQEENNVEVRIVKNTHTGEHIDNWLSGVNHTALTDQLTSASVPLNGVKVYLWHQGEGSAGLSGNLAELDYLTKLSKRVDMTIDSGYLDKDFKFVFGELGEFSTAFLEFNKYLTTYKDYFPNINIGLAKSYGFNHIGDNIHYDAESQYIFGKYRYWGAYNNAIVSNLDSDKNNVYPTEQHLYLEAINFKNVVLENDNNSEFFIIGSQNPNVRNYVNSSDTPKILKTDYSDELTQDDEEFIVLPKSEAVVISNTRNRKYQILGLSYDIGKAPILIDSNIQGSANTVRDMIIENTYTVELEANFLGADPKVHCDKGIITNLSIVDGSNITFDIEVTGRGSLDFFIINDKSVSFEKNLFYTEDIYIQNGVVDYGTEALVATELGLTAGDITDFEIIGNDVVFKTSTTYTPISNAFASSNIRSFEDYEGNMTGTGIASFCSAATYLSRLFIRSAVTFGNFLCSNSARLQEIEFVGVTSISGNSFQKNQYCKRFIAPSLTSIPYGTFKNSTNIIEAYTPNATVSGTSAATNYFGQSDRSTFTWTLKDTTASHNNPAVIEIQNAGGTVIFI